MTIKRYLTQLKTIECVVIVAIIAVLVALLVPQTQWVSDGSIRLPVRMFVFDADRGTPIANARLIVFRGPVVSNPQALAEVQPFIVSGPVSERPLQDIATTDETGSAVIEHEFYTGASHKRPTRHAHLDYAWVRVEADGFGGAVIPVRHESQSTAVLQKQGEIVVQIGLIQLSH